MSTPRPDADPAPREPLFRNEAIEARRERVLGEVLYITPLSYWLFTGFAALLAIAIVVFATLGHYTRKAQVSGYLVPDQGLIKVYAPTTGVVVEQHVEEGQQVRSGDPLYVISMEQGSRESASPQADTLATLEARRASLLGEMRAQADIDGIDSEALSRDIEGLQSELAQLAREIEVQQERIANARSVQARYESLRERKYAAALDTQRQEEQILALRTALHGLYRDRITLQRNLQRARMELSAAGLRAANRRAALEREVAEIDAQINTQALRREVVVKAPRSGVATAVLAHPGQTMSAQMPLLSILPSGSTLQAQLLVPSRAIGFVTSGQSVSIRYQAFPYQRFGSHRGRVSEIARTLIAENDTDLPVRLSEPAYRVTVRLDEQAIEAYEQRFPLQSGMLLDADIQLDRRPIYQWVLDPLYSLTRKS
ncbi:MAG: HlyD family efflux transporter periplasmic adaptor subunit [Gammaproteobacteria bacterium]|nr:HlyD family efflux transporter periplasmic adaptor subunit [Gammaproteobacteria bacterium]